MFFIPGELISLITFPGVIFHEISHRIACDIYDVAVYHVSYFTPLSTTAGCVVHEKSDSLKKSFFIGIAPLLVGSLLCMILTLPYGIKHVLGTDFITLKNSNVALAHTLLSWIGISIGIHAMPSNKDMECVGVLLKQKSNIFYKIILNPIIYSIYFFNLPYIGFWFRLSYGLIILPTVLPKILLF